MRLRYPTLLLFVFSSCIDDATKPPEPVVVITPTSVSTKVVKDEAIVINVKDEKVYLTLGDLKHKDAIINNLNKNNNLGLTDVEIANLKKMELIGLPLNKLKKVLRLNKQLPIAQMEGIPTKDSSNNELTYWIKAVTDAYKDEDINNLNILVKGKDVAKYPVFENIKAALKKNNIYKFKIVTSPD